MLIFYRNHDIQKRCAERADRAAVALKRYMEDNDLTGGLPVEDLLTDLLHLAYRHGVDVRLQAEIAVILFEDDLELVEVGAEAPDALA